MGRLQRRFGLTVDNVVGVELVNADGETLRASEDENADLFWGLRGAGPNFGVATTFEFRLHRMDGTIFQGGIAFPAARSLEVAALVREFLNTHDEVQIWLGFATDAELGDPIVMVSAVHTGPVDEAERDLRILRQSRPLVDTFGPKSYLAVQLMNDEPMAWGKRFYSKSGFLAELSDEVVAGCAAIAETIPPEAELSMWAHGGAVARVPDEAMAYTGRNAAFSVSAETVWTDPAQDETRMAWGRGAIERLKPLMSIGRYVNEVVEPGTDGASIYGNSKYERLVMLKRKYDPDNFFRLNQNIRP